MDITIINSKNYLSQDYYFTKVKEQLMKDINDDDFDTALNDLQVSDADLLFQIVQKYLFNLFSYQTEYFFQLMYRIDIPDKDLRNHILSGQISKESITELILKRELLKVLLREKYSD